MGRRTDAEIEVGYFLSKCSSADLAPPAVLGATTWKQAYAMFHPKLGGGRSLSEFSNSLKNTRDTFDPLFDNGRAGWYQKPERERTIVHERLRHLSAGDLWERVRPWIDASVLEVPFEDIARCAADIDAETAAENDRQSATEGGVKVRTSREAERNPVLRARALRLHGTACMVCDFDFGTMYGQWGEGFGEVHHLVPLAGSDGPRSTDPATDLAVLCANCHRMLHRRRGITLSLDELRRRMELARQRTSGIASTGSE